MGRAERFCAFASFQLPLASNSPYVRVVYFGVLQKGFKIFTLFIKFFFSGYFLFLDATVNMVFISFYIQMSCL